MMRKPMTTTELNDQVALVTGASSGIGEATAEALATEGARVVLAARRTDRLNTLADRIKTAGGKASVITVDITQKNQVREMVRTAHDEFGRLDILVNNAGVMLLAPVEQADTDDWQQMVTVNLLGTMNATHAALPALREDEGGHVVNVSSDARRSANSSFSAYAATKAGVTTFSQSLRQEVTEDGVRVTVIEPGAVDTELPEHIPDEETKADVETTVASMTPLESEDVAAAIVYAVTQPPRVNVDELLIRPM